VDGFGVNMLSFPPLVLIVLSRKLFPTPTDFVDHGVVGVAVHDCLIPVHLFRQKEGFIMILYDDHCFFNIIIGMIIRSITNNRVTRTALCYS
jgi:hypothetical protein